MRIIIPACHHIASCSFVLIFLTSLFYTPTIAHTSKQTEIIKHTISNDPSADGFWKSNVQWKSRWVKYWRPKAIYVPIWKKVWSPIVQNEWVPLPKVPPGWEVRKDGIIDSTNSDWSSSSHEHSAHASSGGREARAIKSYSGRSKGSTSSSGSSRSSYAYSTSRSGASDWRKGARRTIVREIE